MDSKKERILITGASGFIGTNALLHFAKNYEVMNIDIAAPKDDAFRGYWKQVDICDFEALRDAVLAFAPHYILHLAARTDLNGKTVDDYRANTDGVRNIVEVARQLPNLRKIVVTSSMLVCHVGYIPTDENDYCPTTRYGESKVETERIVRQAALSVDWALLRPTSIWGPWFHVPYRSFFDMVKRRLYFHIGHQSCTKTYGYVGNAVYQIEQILFSDTTAASNKVFYLGDEPAIPIEEWANQIAAQLGHRVPRVPWWAIRCAALVGDALKSLGIPFPMSSFRLKNMTTNNIIPLTNTYAIAPRPPFTREEGIKATLEWMEQH